jgi:hypothetical protein
VRAHFLMPRYLRDYLKIIRSGLDGVAAGGPGVPAAAEVAQPTE